MSLVNKMLRDLDARRAGEAERGVLPPAVTPLHDDSGVPRSRIAALIVLAVLAAGGAAAYLGYLPAPDDLFPTPAPPSALAPAAPAVPAVAPAPPAPTVTVAAAPAATDSALPAAQQAAAMAIAPDPATLPGDFSLRLDTGLERAPEPKPAPAAPPAKPAAKAEKPKPDAKPEKAAKPVATASAPAVAAPAEPPRIEKQERQASPGEKADAEFRRGQQAQRQGASDAALSHYRLALAEQAEHAGARRALAGLLIEQRHYDDAEAVLRQGMALLPGQVHWPMTLARLRVERGDTGGALDILQKQAAAGANSADWQGFHGALLQRLGRSADAVVRYEAATRLAPTEARWWAGLGIALDGTGRAAQARAAFERARALPGLPPELAAHVERRLR